MADPQLAPDGEHIIYVDNENGVENLFREDLNGGNRGPITHFSDAQQIDAFAASSDGSIAIARSKDTRDIVLITNLR